MRGAKMASALVSSNRAGVLKSVVLACVLGTAFGVPTARAGDECEPRWSALTGPGGTGVSDPSGSSFVRALAVFDDGGGAALYAGGFFSTAGGVTVNGIARWDGASWSPLGSGIAGEFLPTVWALTVFDDGTGPALYAGGSDFTTAGGVTVNNIARWDGSAWSALTGPGGTGVDFTVAALTVFDDGSGPALYVGGNFTSAGGVTVNRIARWNGSAWSGLTGPGGTGVNGTVWSLTVFDDGSGGGPALYAGGVFTTAGGVTVNRIARWDGSAWSALTGSGGTGVGSWVNAMAVFDDGTGSALYAGGIFITAGGVTVNRIARWDGSVWSPLTVPGGTGVNGQISALRVFDDGTGPALYAGGYFDTAGGLTVNRVARWDGSTWSTLTGPGGTGVMSPGGVLALMAFDHGIGAGPALYAGGDFTTAGGVTANGIAKWQGCAVTPPPCLADINGDGVLDFFDVQMFLSLYASGNLAADFTGDGTLDFFDVQAFLNLYAAGCP
ncbi:MAG: hypothetical protein KF757_08165 [Phycisphaeraceae bacterium]|nr:hypothetical protein [Phycisphaeraceae bacterium]MCW5762730.1 hypothetical protein [Phycisphaeraceae bacterium]